MLVQISSSPYSNPYRSLIAFTGDPDPLAPMRRFKKDVVLPVPPGTSQGDPFEPLRRFRRDITPPRFTPIDLSTGGRLSASIDSMWQFIPGREMSSMAIDAYRNASSSAGRGSMFDSIR